MLFELSFWLRALPAPSFSTSSAWRPVWGERSTSGTWPLVGTTMRSGTLPSALVPVPGAKKPPTWDGVGAPKEPYAYVDHMRGDFDGIWADARN